MGHSRLEKSESHDRILDVAVAQFKGRGFNGIGLAELMEHAGLTHGAFYKHFASRDSLVTESVFHAFAQDRVRFAHRLEKVTGDRLAAHIDDYLTTAHRDERPRGCSMVALGSEISRAGDDVKAAFQEHFQVRCEWLANELGGPKAEAKRHALTIMSAMVGALTVARAMADPALSESILDSARKEIKALAKRLRSELRGG